MSKLKITDVSNRFRSRKSALLETLANSAINQFKVENFDAQGFIDNAVQPWAPRKSKSKKDVGRKILVKTGRLRNSITVLERSSDSITVGSEVPYADFINEGTPKMVKRKFMGYSEKLRVKNQRVVNNFLKGL